LPVGKSCVEGVSGNEPRHRLCCSSHPRRSHGGLRPRHRLHDQQDEDLRSNCGNNLDLRVREHLHRIVDHGSRESGGNDVPRNRDVRAHVPGSRRLLDGPTVPSSSSRGDLTMIASNNTSAGPCRRTATGPAPEPP